MKSKKKLIYKLHENMQENPFKPIQQISLRNMGVRAYDYNKTKSVKAMSLNSINTSPTREIHNLNSIGKIALLKKVNQSYFINQRNQKQPFPSKKRSNVDKNLIDIQSKKIQVRRPLKNQKQLTKHRFSYIQNDQVSKCSRYQQADCKKYTQRQNDDQLIRCVQQDVLNPNLPKMQARHVRHVSLSQFNQIKQDCSLSALNSVNIRQRQYSKEDQQKAKQQILRQLRITQQQKINKKIIISIKLRSVSNLQRIGVCQSEVVKIDKWKEKYAKNKQSDQGQNQEKIKKVFTRNKIFFPELDKLIMRKYAIMGKIQQTDRQRAQIVYTNQTKQSQPSSIRYNQKQQQKYLINQLGSKNISTEFFTQLKRQHSNAQTAYFRNPPEQNSPTQQRSDTDKNCDEESPQKINCNQSLKLSITKKNMQQRKNVRNLNLQNKIKQLTKNQEESPYKRKSKYQNLHKMNQVSDQFINQMNQKYKLSQTEGKMQSNSSYLDKPQQKKVEKKSKMLTDLEKSEQRNGKNSDQTYQKCKKYQKCKINQQDNIFDKTMQDGIPKQWQDQINDDYQEIQFGNFVQFQFKQPT